MPPFAHFRLWLREGPTAERWGAALASLVVLALLALALVPVSNGAGSGGSSAEGPAPGTLFPTAAASSSAAPAGSPGAVAPPPILAPGRHHHGGVTVAPGSPGSTPGVTPARSSGHSPRPIIPTPADECAGAPLTVGTGVTQSEVKIDVATVQLAGAVGDSAFNIPQNQNGIVDAVANYINHHGGVACGRKLALKLYKVNPIDSNNQQSTCLQMAQDKPLAVINLGSYVTPVSQECFVRNHVPLATGTSLGVQQARDAYPYLFSPIASSEEQVRDGILGAAAHGAFKSSSFKKIALFEDSCLPSANAEIANDLAKSGVSKSQITSYTLSCELVGSPTQILQAVAKAKTFGADTVFLASSVLNNENFVSDSGQQNFHPRWITSDYGTTTTGSGSSKWAKNFNGAIAITSTRSGELNSHLQSPQLKLCNKILAQNKQPTVKNENTDDGASSFCDLVFFMSDAINHAGANPTRLSLVQNLGTMGRFRTAYDGDSVWNTAGELTGGDYQREIEWYGYCRCWKVKSTSVGPAY